MCIKEQTDAFTVRGNRINTRPSYCYVTRDKIASAKSESIKKIDGYDACSVKRCTSLSFEYEKGKKTMSKHYIR